VICRHAGRGDEGAEVAEGSQNIRVEASECIFCVLIRAVCTDLCGPAENPDLLSCDGSFLRSFREQMRGFHDLLPVHIAGMELSVSRFGGEDGSVV
jgi:hypothetical protein